jgi:hypothetical protein|tara:strand:- start:1054 stop:2598 length:1545 start_codon:yes stop_codon:yes gene_type:complete
MGDLSIYRRHMDIWETAEKLRVKTKEGPRRPFVLRPQQTTLLRTLLTKQDTLVLKPRQIGASTLVAYYLFWTWFTSPDPITIAILSYKQRSSKKLLKMVKSFYSELPASLRRPLSTNNTEALELEDSEAEIIAVGAQDDGGTRSFTAHLIWLSEFAFMPNADELIATTEGSITENGQIIAESTANHWNDALHVEIQKVDRGESDWAYIFFPWKDHEEYRRSGVAGVLSEEEQRLQLEHGLDEAQLLWRRRKVSKLGEEMFPREYPLTIKDAYAQSAGSFFSEADLQGLGSLQSAPTGTTLFEKEPDRSALYVAGFDPGGGVGLDNSSLYILNATTGEPAAVWRKNRHTFDEALEVVAALCIKFEAALCIEYNNHGHGYYEAYRSLGEAPGLKLHTDAGKPFFTDRKSKRLLWTHVKKSIQQGDVVTVPEAALADLRQLQVDEHGRIVLPRTSGGHCDDAQALGLALWAAKGRRLRRQNMVDRLISKKRAEAIRARSGSSLTAHGATMHSGRRSH